MIAKVFGLKVGLYVFAVIFVLQLMQVEVKQSNRKHGIKKFHKSSSISLKHTNLTKKSVIRDKRKYLHHTEKSKHAQLEPTFSEPSERNIIFSPDESKDKEAKRNVLLYPPSVGLLNVAGGQNLQILRNQLFQGSHKFVPKAEVNVVGSRRGSPEDADSLLSARSQDDGYVLLPQSRMYPDQSLPSGMYPDQSLPSRMYPDQSYGIPQGSEPLVSTAAESVMDGNLARQMADTRSMPVTEETLVGKLVANEPKENNIQGLDLPLLQQTLKQEAESLAINPTSKEYRHAVDNILLDKFLNNRFDKLRENVTCDPVALSLVANCSGNDEPNCLDSDLSSFRRNGLEQHKILREIHTTPPVNLNDKLNTDAQKYAEALANGSKFDYSDGKDRPGQGENIAVRCSDDGSVLTAKEAVNYWYAKICQDNVDLNTYSPELSQFSQVVWKDSNYLGLGRTMKRKGDLLCTYIVARYSPEANKNNFYENVQRGIFDENRFCTSRCNLPDKPKSIDENHQSSLLNQKTHESAPTKLESSHASSSHERDQANVMNNGSKNAQEKNTSSMTDVSSFTKPHADVNSAETKGDKNENPQFSLSTPNRKLHDEAHSLDTSRLIQYYPEPLTNTFDNMEDENNLRSAGSKLSNNEKSDLKEGQEDMTKQNKFSKSLSENIDHIENLKFADSKKLGKLLDDSNRNGYEAGVENDNLDKHQNKYFSGSDKGSGGGSHGADLPARKVNGFENESKKPARFSSYQEVLKKLRKNDGDHSNDDEPAKFPSYSSVVQKLKINDEGESKKLDFHGSMNEVKIKADAERPDAMSSPNKLNIYHDAEEASSQNNGKLDNTNHFSQSKMEGEKEETVNFGQRVKNETKDKMTSEVKHLDETAKNKPEVMVFINRTSDDVKKIQAKMKEIKVRKAVANKTSPLKFQDEGVEDSGNSPSSSLKDHKLVDVNQEIESKHHAEKKIASSAYSISNKPTDEKLSTKKILQNLFDEPGADDSKGPLYIQLLPARELDDFRKEIAMQHNKFRVIHQSPFLTLDKDLSRDAQIYAAYTAKHSTVAHSNPSWRPNTGESVAEICTKEGVLPTAEHVVNKWYSEICDPGFDFAKEGRQSGTGHFTQIVWKNTRKLGVGLAVANRPNGDSCSYIVARYKNAGNYLDKFKNNVHEGSFKKTKCGADLNKNIDTLLESLDPKITSDILAAKKANVNLRYVRRPDSSNFVLSEAGKTRTPSINPIALSIMANHVPKPKDHASSKPKIPLKNFYHPAPTVSSPGIQRLNLPGTNQGSSVALEPRTTSYAQPQAQVNSLRTGIESRKLQTPASVSNVQPTYMFTSYYPSPYDRHSQTSSAMNYSKSKRKRRSSESNEPIRQQSLHKTAKANQTKNVETNGKLNYKRIKQEINPSKVASNSEEDEIIDAVAVMNGKTSKKHINTPKSATLSTNSKSWKQNNDILDKAQHTQLSKSQVERDMDVLFNEAIKSGHQQNFAELTAPRTETKSVDRFSPLKKSKSRSNKSSKKLQVVSVHSKNHSKNNSSTKHTKEKATHEKQLRKSSSKRMQKPKTKKVTLSKEKLNDSSDNDLENYLKTIVVKLRSFDKKTNKMNKDQFNKEIRKFADLNEKAIKSKSQIHHNLSKQSIIPDPLKKQPLAKETVTGSRRVFENALLEPVADDVEAYVKSFNKKASTDKISPDVQRRLIHENSKLKDAVSYYDQPLSKEFENLGSMYGVDLDAASRVILNRNPIAMNFENPSSDVVTDQIKFVGDTDHSRESPDEFIQNIEGALLSGKEYKAEETKNVNNSTESSIKESVNHNDAAQTDSLPSEMSAVNHEASVVSNHITDTIFDHDDQNHLTFLKENFKNKDGSRKQKKTQEDKAHLDKVVVGVKENKSESNAKVGVGKGASVGATTKVTGGAQNQSDNVHSNLNKLDYHVEFVKTPNKNEDKTSVISNEDFTDRNPVVNDAKLKNSKIEAGQSSTSEVDYHDHLKVSNADESTQSTNQKSEKPGEKQNQNLAVLAGIDSYVEPTLSDDKETGSILEDREKGRSQDKEAEKLSIKEKQEKIKKMKKEREAIEKEIEVEERMLEDSKAVLNEEKRPSKLDNEESEPNFNQKESGSADEPVSDSKQENFKENPSQDYESSKQLKHRKENQENNEPLMEDDKTERFSNETKVSENASENDESEPSKSKNHQEYSAEDGKGELKHSKQSNRLAHLTEHFSGDILKEHKTSHPEQNKHNTHASDNEEKESLSKNYKYEEPDSDDDAIKTNNLKDTHKSSDLDESSNSEPSKNLEHSNENQGLEPSKLKQMKFKNNDFEDDQLKETHLKQSDHQENDRPTSSHSKEESKSKEKPSKNDQSIPSQSKVSKYKDQDDDEKPLSALKQSKNNAHSSENDEPSKSRIKQQNYPSRDSTSLHHAKEMESGDLFPNNDDWKTFDSKPLKNNKLFEVSNDEISQFGSKHMKYNENSSENKNDAPLPSHSKHGKSEHYFSHDEQLKDEEQVSDMTKHTPAHSKGEKYFSETDESTAERDRKKFLKLYKNHKNAHLKHQAFEEVDQHVLNKEESVQNVDGTKSGKEVTQFHKEINAPETAEQNNMAPQEASSSHASMNVALLPNHSPKETSSNITATAEDLRLLTGLNVKALPHLQNQFIVNGPSLNQYGTTEDVHVVGRVSMQQSTENEDDADGNEHQNLDDATETSSVQLPVDDAFAQIPNINFNPTGVGLPMNFAAKGHNQENQNPASVQSSNQDSNALSHHGNPESQETPTVNSWHHGNVGHEMHHKGNLVHEMDPFADLNREALSHEAPPVNHLHHGSVGDGDQPVDVLHHGEEQAHPPNNAVQPTQAGCHSAFTDKHKEKVVDEFGLLPTFGFASFGSPVVLHLGATGFFEDNRAFSKIGLTTHNKVREVHDSQELIQHPHLTMGAIRHAVYMSTLGFLKHDKPEHLMGAGENLFLGCYDGEYDISAEEVVLRWYAEVCHPGYNFNQSYTCSGTGHFTQVIWDTSVYLGMAKMVRMQNGLRCTYVVARYFPAGNTNNGYNKNVKKGSFEEEKVCRNVFKRLIDFERRNKDKAAMAELEKQHGQSEFVKHLKENEQAVRSPGNTGILKDETNSTSPLPSNEGSNDKSFHAKDGDNDEPKFELHFDKMKKPGKDSKQSKQSKGSKDKDDNADKPLVELHLNKMEKQKQSKQELLKTSKTKELANTLTREILKEAHQKHIKVDENEVHADAIRMLLDMNRKSSHEDSQSVHGLKKMNYVVENADFADSDHSSTERVKNFNVGRKETKHEGLLPPSIPSDTSLAPTMGNYDPTPMASNVECVNAAESVLRCERPEARTVVHLVDGDSHLDNGLQNPMVKNSIPSTTKSQIAKLVLPKSNVVVGNKGQKGKTTLCSTNIDKTLADICKQNLLKFNKNPKTLPKPLNVNLQKQSKSMGFGERISKKVPFLPASNIPVISEYTNSTSNPTHGSTLRTSTSMKQPASNIRNIHGITPSSKTPFLTSQPSNGRMSEPLHGISGVASALMRVSCKNQSKLNGDCGKRLKQLLPLAFQKSNAGDISVFQMNALTTHNKYRRLHMSPTLKLNKDMSKEATDYAKKIAKTGTLQHSGTQDGENIATVCREKNMLMTGEEATDIWYREVCDPGYDFVTALPGKAGHFTQVIWKDSKNFGIGRAAEMHDGLLCTFIVARYRPAGNFVGEFAENVPKGKFTTQQCVSLARKNEIEGARMQKRSGIPRLKSKGLVNREKREVDDLEDFDSLLEIVMGEKPDPKKSEKHSKKSKLPGEFSDTFLKNTLKENVTPKKSSSDYFEDLMENNELKKKNRLHESEKNLEKSKTSDAFQDALLALEDKNSPEISKKSSRKSKSFEGFQDGLTENAVDGKSSMSLKTPELSDAFGDMFLKEAMEGTDAHRKESKKSKTSESFQDNLFENSKDEKSSLIKIKNSIKKSNTATKAKYKSKRKYHGSKKSKKSKNSKAVKKSNKSGSTHSSKHHHSKSKASKKSQQTKPNKTKRKKKMQKEIISSPAMLKTKKKKHKMRKVKKKKKKKRTKKMHQSFKRKHKKSKVKTTRKSKNSGTSKHNTINKNKKTVKQTSERRLSKVSNSEKKDQMPDVSYPPSWFSLPLNQSIEDLKSVSEKGSMTKKHYPAVERIFDKPVEDSSDIMLEKELFDIEHSLEDLAPGAAKFHEKLDAKTDAENRIVAKTVFEDKTVNKKNQAKESLENELKHSVEISTNYGKSDLNKASKVDKNVDNLIAPDPDDETENEAETKEIITRKYGKKVKVKFSENETGVITPLTETSNHVNCDLHPKDPTCKRHLSASGATLHSDSSVVVPSPLASRTVPVDDHSISLGAILNSDDHSTAPLQENPGSLEVARKIGDDLESGTKTNDENEQLIAASTQHDILPPDELLRKSGFQNTEDVLKMAKIGSIALELAKKKMLQNKIAARIEATHLPAYDLLKYLQEKPGMLDSIASGKSARFFGVDVLDGAVDSQLKKLAREAVAELENRRSKAIARNNKDVSTDQSKLASAIETVAENNTPLKNENHENMDINKPSFTNLKSLAGGTQPQQHVTNVLANPVGSQAHGTLNFNGRKGKPMHETQTGSNSNMSRPAPSFQQPVADEIEFEQAALNAHNAYRSVHDAEDLILDTQLNREANNKARFLARPGNLGKKSHLHAEGENIAVTCKHGTDGEKMTGPDATMKWYNQVCKPEFVFGVDRPQTEATPFTQVVWKATKKIGIGRATYAKEGKLCTVVVARYFPGASLKGIHDNVQRGAFNTETYCSGLGAVVDVGNTGHRKSSAAGHGVSANTQDFRQEALNLQNELRAVHGSPSLGLNEKLSLEAEQFASQLARNGAVKHSDTYDGENLVKSCNENNHEITADEAIRKWYNEVCNPGYNFLSESTSSGTSSFTQMVWKGTQRFGIGKATVDEDGMKCTYVVARYQPKGEIGGNFQANVLKGAFDFPYCQGLGKSHWKSSGIHQQNTFALESTNIKRNKIQKVATSSHKLFNTNKNSTTVRSAEVAKVKGARLNKTHENKHTDLKPKVSRKVGNVSNPDSLLNAVAKKKKKKLDKQEIDRNRKKVKSAPVAINNHKIKTATESKLNPSKKESFLDQLMDKVTIDFSGKSVTVSTPNTTTISSYSNHPNVAVKQQKNNSSPSKPAKTSYFTNQTKSYGNKQIHAVSSLKSERGNHIGNAVNVQSIVHGNRSKSHDNATYENDPYVFMSNTKESRKGTRVVSGRSGHSVMSVKNRKKSSGAAKIVTIKPMSKNSYAMFKSAENKKETWFANNQLKKNLTSFSRSEYGYGNSDRRNTGHISIGKQLNGNRVAENITTIKRPINRRISSRRKIGKQFTESRLTGGRFAHNVTIPKSNNGDRISGDHAIGHHFTGHRIIGNYITDNLTPLNRVTDRRGSNQHSYEKSTEKQFTNSPVTDHLGRSNRLLAYRPVNSLVNTKVSKVLNQTSHIVKNTTLSSKDKVPILPAKNLISSIQNGSASSAFKAIDSYSDQTKFSSLFTLPSENKNKDSFWSDSDFVLPETRQSEKHKSSNKKITHTKKHLPESKLGKKKAKTKIDFENVGLQFDHPFKSSTFSDSGPVLENAYHQQTKINNAMGTVKSPSSGADHRTKSLRVLDYPVLSVHSLYQDKPQGAALHNISKTTAKNSSRIHDVSKASHTGLYKNWVTTFTPVSLSPMNRLSAVSNTQGHKAVNITSVKPTSMDYVLPSITAKSADQSPKTLKNLSAGKVAVPMTSTSSSNRERTTSRSENLIRQVSGKINGFMKHREPVGFEKKVKSTTHPKHHKIKHTKTHRHRSKDKRKKKMKKMKSEKLAASAPMKFRVVHKINNATSATSKSDHTKRNATQHGKRERLRNLSSREKYLANVSPLTKATMPLKQRSKLMGRKSKTLTSDNISGSKSVTHASLSPINGQLSDGFTFIRPNDRKPNLNERPEHVELFQKSVKPKSSGDRLSNSLAELELSNYTKATNVSAKPSILDSLPLNASKDVFVNNNSNFVANPLLNNSYSNATSKDDTVVLPGNVTTNFSLGGEKVYDMGYNDILLNATSNMNTSDFFLNNDTSYQSPNIDGVTLLPSSSKNNASADVENVLWNMTSASTSSNMNSTDASLTSNPSTQTSVVNQPSNILASNSSGAVDVDENHKNYTKNMPSKSINVDLSYGNKTVSLGRTSDNTTKDVPNLVNATVEELNNVSFNLTSRDNKTNSVVTNNTLGDPTNIMGYDVRAGNDTASSNDANVPSHNTNDMLNLASVNLMEQNLEAKMRKDSGITKRDEIPRRTARVILPDEDLMAYIEKSEVPNLMYVNHVLSKNSDKLDDLEDLR